MSGTWLISIKSSFLLIFEFLLWISKMVLDVWYMVDINQEFFSFDIWVSFVDFKDGVRCLVHGFCCFSHFSLHFRNHDRKPTSLFRKYASGNFLLSSKVIFLSLIENIKSLLFYKENLFSSTRVFFTWLIQTSLPSVVVVKTITCLTAE